jgi:hypothetical protein
VFGSDKVVVPPRDTSPPPVKPVPAVTVKDELARAAFAIEFAGKVTVPEEIVSPLEPVSRPADVIVPVPLVEIFPEVVIASPELLGDSVVPVRFKYPSTPEVGAVDVRFLDASVYTPVEAVNPESVSEVNDPVPGVVAPILVELIPVAVVLKLPLVNVKLLAPVEIEEAPRPDKDNAPEVVVKFKAPVVNVNPFEAVTSPEKVGLVTVAKVIVPAALFVVVMFVPAANVKVPPWEMEEFDPVVEAAVNKLPPLTKHVGQVRVNAPPRESAPPPLNGPVVLTVTEEFARLAFVIPAEPDKLELVNPAIAVGVTEVTLPCASVVKTGMESADP